MVRPLEGASHIHTIQVFIWWNRRLLRESTAISLPLPSPLLSVAYYCLKSLNISRLGAPVEVLNRHPGGADVRRLMLLRVQAQPSHLSSLFSIAVLSSVYSAA